MKSLPEKTSKTLSKQNSMTSKTPHAQIPKFKVQVMLDLQKKGLFKIKAEQRDRSFLWNKKKPKMSFLPRIKIPLEINQVEISFRQFR